MRATISLGSLAPPSLNAGCPEYPVTSYTLVIGDSEGNRISIPITSWLLVDNEVS